VAIKKDKTLTVKKLLLVDPQNHLKAIQTLETLLFRITSKHHNRNVAV